MALLRRRRGAAAAAPALVLALALALLVSNRASAAPEKPKLVVSRLVPSKGVTDEDTRTIDNLLESELSRLSIYEVMSANTIATLIGAERQRQLMGCGEGNSACMAEVANALNADRLISGDLARADRTWVLNLSLVDGRKGKLIKRVGRQAKDLSVAPLLEQVRGAVYELVNADPALAGKPLRLDRPFGGLVIGLRGDVDVLAPGLAIAPAVTVQLSSASVGGCLALIAQDRPGVRLEARVHPWVLAERVQPFLVVGSTAFLNGVAVRGGAGATVKLDRLQLSLDAAYERYVLELGPKGELLPNAVLIGASVAWGL